MSRQILYVSWDEENRGGWKVFIFTVFFVPPRFREGELRNSSSETIKLEVILRNPNDTCGQSLTELEVSIFCKSEEYFFYNFSLDDLNTMVYLFNKAREIMKKHEEEDHEKK